MSTLSTRDLHDLDLTELRAALARREVSAQETAQHFLTRANAHADLGAYVALNPEVTLAQARAADARIAAGTAGTLEGIPIAHKDILVTRDFPTTAGSKMLAGYQSPFDATVVSRLAQAGAVTLGKLNCDEFAMGSSNENSAITPVSHIKLSDEAKAKLSDEAKANLIDEENARNLRLLKNLLDEKPLDEHSPVRNPWAHDRVPGGSSGGSAAAVAARLAPAATGTDTGGSIRQPASFCGITGIKPTYGRASRYGMVAFASSLDQAGPMARSAQDCALLLSAMCGADLDRDSTSLDMPDEDFSRQLNHSLQGLRIGIPQEFFGEGLADDVRQPIDQALQQYQAMGATLVPISLPRTALSIPVYYVIAPAEASSNLSRFDGVKFGYRAPDHGNLLDMYKKTRTQGFGDEVKRRIMIGTYVLSHGYYDAYYLQAQKIRRMIADDFQQAFQSCDIIAGPVAPTVAWKLGEHGNDPLADYLADIYTLPASLAGLPGMSVPVGFGAHGLPVGLQLIGNYFQEARLLNAAHQLQTVTDFHLRQPGGL